MHSGSFMLVCPMPSAKSTQRSPKMKPLSAAKANPRATSAPEKQTKVKSDRVQLGNAAKENILFAALRCFAKSGFDGASMLEIARAAEVGHPLVHYHFRTKEDLWKASATFAFNDLARAFEAVELASDGLAPIDKLKLMCRAFARFTARYPQHVALLVNESKIDSPRFHWLLDTFLRPMHKRLDLVIEQATLAGQIIPIPPVHLTSFVIGSITQFIFAGGLTRELYDLDPRSIDTVNNHADWMIKVIMDGIAVQPIESR